MGGGGALLFSNILKMDILNPFGHLQPVVLHVSTKNIKNFGDLGWIINKILPINNRKFLYLYSKGTLWVAILLFSTFSSFVCDIILYLVAV